VDEFADCLKKDFGSIDDASRMSAMALVMGPHGLNGFLDEIIDPLLDTLPINHPSYSNLMALLSTFCKELARKISNHRKVSSCTLHYHDSWFT
jgi:hypothetical protein